MLEIIPNTLVIQEDIANFYQDATRDRIDERASEVIRASNNFVNDHLANLSRHNGSYSPTAFFRPLSRMANHFSIKPDGVAKGHRPVADFAMRQIDSMILGRDEDANGKEFESVMLYDGNICFDHGLYMHIVVNSLIAAFNQTIDPNAIDASV